MGIRADEYVSKERTNVMMYFDTDDDVPFCCECWLVNLIRGTLLRNQYEKYLTNLFMNLGDSFGETFIGSNNEIDGFLENT